MLCTNTYTPFLHSVCDENVLKRNLTLDQVFEFIMKECVKNGREIEIKLDREENREDMWIIKWLEDTWCWIKYSHFLWCEFDLTNNLTLDQVSFVSFEMFYFILSFYIFSWHAWWTNKGINLGYYTFMGWGDIWPTMGGWNHYNKNGN